MHYTFCKATAGAYDLDNMVARMKAIQDGIAHAIGVDDRHWTTTYERGPVTKPGMVLVRIKSLGPIPGEQFAMGV